MIGGRKMVRYIYVRVLWSFYKTLDGQLTEKWEMGIKVPKKLKIDTKIPICKKMGTKIQL